MRTAPLLPALLLLLPAASPAGPLAVHEWDARPADPRPYLGRIPHGSAARLVARLPGPVASASFHWQTNGMGGLWWDAPAECLSNAVSAVWTPAMDCGAAEYRAFFRIEQPEGPDYGAFCHLAMLDSPGFAPNALPLPVRTLDFAAIQYTNAPWALPSDLSEYATTSQVAEAIATIDIPDPDLSEYATTGLVASLHKPPAEWATNAYAWIGAEPDYDAGGLRVAETGDVCRADTAAPGIAALRLSALEEVRDAEGAGVRALGGAWSIAAGGAHATLSGDLLQPTGETGPVAVQFARDDGGDALRASVAMQMAPALATAWDIHSETTNAWRRQVVEGMAVLFRGIDTNGVKTAYRHGRGGEPDTWCSLYLAQQIYATDEVANPTAPNPLFFFDADHLSSMSVGRTDFQTGPSTRPATMVAPHYAICAAHYTPSRATFQNGQTLAFSAVATLGDLRLLRSDAAWTDDGVCVPRFLPASVLARKSPSLLAGSLAVYQSQHGTLHPCLVIPYRPDGRGWITVRPGGNFRAWGYAVRNATWADLDAYGHDVHGGDSGHCVFLRLYTPVGEEWIVPVGLYGGANGSGQSLLDDAVISWLDSHIRADSGGEENLRILTYEDL